MTPELIGIIALFGAKIALGVALFGAFKWFSDRVDKRFDRIETDISEMKADISKLKEGQARLDGMEGRVDKRFDGMEGRVDKRFDDMEARSGKRFDRSDERFDRVEADLSGLKEGQARLEGMFEGAFERIPRVRPDNGGEAAASSGAPASTTPARE